MKPRNLICALAALMVLPLAHAADAETPRGCRADAQKFCKDVQPGGGRVAQCLKRNEASLSEGCRERIAEGRRKMHEFAEDCKPDAQKFCKDVGPGHGRVMHCLAEHKDQLSPACRERVSAVGQRHPCMADAARLCEGVKPGGGRVANCLKSRESELSAECRAHRRDHPRAAPGEDGG